MSSAHQSYLPSPPWISDLIVQDSPLSTMVLVYHAERMVDKWAVHILLEYVPVCIPSFLERYNSSS